MKRPSVTTTTTFGTARKHSDVQNQRLCDRGFRCPGVGAVTMKTLLNGWSNWRASKKNSTGLMTAAIGWRAALKAVLIVWLVRGIVWPVSAGLLVLYGLMNK